MKFEIAIRLRCQSLFDPSIGYVNISIYDGIGNLPHFNPDLNREETLAPVMDWRTHLQAADGVIFCTPEYAHGVPGVLKNALDWIIAKFR